MINIIFTGLKDDIVKYIFICEKAITKSPLMSSYGDMFVIRNGELNCCRKIAGEYFFTAVDSFLNRKFVKFLNEDQIVTGYTFSRNFCYKDILVLLY